MYLRIIKSDDSIITVKNGTIITTNDQWYIPDIATPTYVKIPDEILREYNTPEKREELTLNTRFYLQDSEDKKIIYKVVISLAPQFIGIVTDIYDDKKYLCGKFVGIPYFSVFDFPKHKKDLKFMIELSRN